MEEIYNVNKDGSKTIGILKVAKANNVVEAVSELPDLSPLYDQLWYEEEVSCLYASTNLGKSILAVQIANEIAKTRTVLYVDCELSDRQFSHRYSSDHNRFIFEERLHRATIDISGAAEMDEEQLISSIHMAAVEIGAKVLVIDNLSWLSMSSEKAADATKLMRRLIGLRNMYKYSILIIAHTPKVSKGEFLTDNQLAGSKSLMNFMDSAFCIGINAKEKNGRYIKQTKVRASEYKYDENSVLVCRIIKDPMGALRFESVGTAPERDMKSNYENELKQQEKFERARELYQQGQTIREIETTLEVRHGTFKKSDLESPQVPDPGLGDAGLEPNVEE